MEGEVHCKDLSDDLVAKIITMMPFPAILKARGLSKTWKARFSSFSADDAEAKRCLVPSFHSDVLERSKTWGIMWVVFMRKGQLLAYNYESQTWRTMLSLSFPPPFGSLLVPALPSSDAARVQRTRQQIEGALVLITQHVAGESPHYTNLTEIYVGNLLTSSCKCLQVPLGVSLRVFYHKLVVDDPSNAYKVILLDYRGQAGLGPEIGVYIYDSASDAWSFNSVQLPFTSWLPTSAAYSNMIVYMLPWENLRNLQGELFVYNLEKRTFNRFRLSHPYFTVNFPYICIENVTLLTYKEDLLMVVCAPDLGPYLSFTSSTDALVRVLRIDLKTGRWVLLAKAVSYRVKLPRKVQSTFECTIGGDCIFMDFEDFGRRRVVLYNLEDNDSGDARIEVPAGPSKWIGPSCFNPSRHTFMSV